MGGGEELLGHILGCCLMSNGLVSLITKAGDLDC